MEINVEVSNVQLTDVVNPGDEYYKAVTIADLVAEKLLKTAIKEEGTYLKERINKIRDEAIQELLEPIIREAIEGPIYLTNSYGEKTGKETTLRELISELAKRILSYKDGYTKKSWVDEFIRKEINTVLTKELQDLVAAEKKKVISALKDNVAEVITAAVTRGIGLK